MKFSVSLPAWFRLLYHMLNCPGKKNTVPCAGSSGQEKTSPVKGRFSRFLQTVTLFETVNTSAAVHKLLFASEKRMALAADFDRQVFFRRTGLEGLAASTANGSFAVFRMDVLLHDDHSFENTTKS